MNRYKTEFSQKCFDSHGFSGSGSTFCINLVFVHDFYWKNAVVVQVVSTSIDSLPPQTAQASNYLQFFDQHSLKTNQLAITTQ